MRYFLLFLFSTMTVCCYGAPGARLPPDGPSLPLCRPCWGAGHGCRSCSGQLLRLDKASLASAAAAGAALGVSAIRADMALHRSWDVAFTHGDTGGAGARRAAARRACCCLPTALQLGHVARCGSSPRVLRPRQQCPFSSVCPLYLPRPQVR